MLKLKKIDNFYKFILAMIGIKIILMGLFSSDYQNQMFERFICGFLEMLKTGNGWNPYEVFAVEQGLFPYPPTMLLIESVGGILITIFNEVALFWKNFLFKLPTLLFDCLGLYWMTKMFPENRKYVAVLYFASPIILYAAYMHGQLDLMPTVLLLGALYYLRQWGWQRRIGFPVLLALSLTSKFHIAAVLPILFLYIEKRDGLIHAIKALGSAIMLSVVVILPFWETGFLNSVVFNNEQTVLTKVYLEYVNVKLYIPLLAVGLVYLKTFYVANINKDLLYSFCGLLFAVFLTTIPPMPGWYIWIVPFVAIFFIDICEDKYKTLFIYIALNAAYLLYFIFAHKTEYVDLYLLTYDLSWLKIQDGIWKDLLFTGLTCLLIYSVWLMYQKGITSNSLYKRRNLPFTIGISGDSGSGKSTLISLFSFLFGDKNLLCIEGDGDHKWERGNVMWTHFTHLNPKANHIYRQAKDIATLRAGQYVKRVDYDHETGTFTKEYKITPKPYIILCGLHSLYLPQIRNEMDLKIYMDIDETLRRYWKMQRDVEERGYSKENLLKQIEDRIPDAKKYIYPQKKYADLTITYFDETLSDYMAENHEEHLSLKVTMSAAIDMEPLIRELEEYRILIRYDYDDDLRKQIITFYGEELEKKGFSPNDMAVKLIPHLDEIIDGKLEAEDNLHSILSLVILIHISNILSGGIK